MLIVIGIFSSLHQSSSGLPLSIINYSTFSGAATKPARRIEVDAPHGQRPPPEKGRHRVTAQQHSKCFAGDPLFSALTNLETQVQLILTGLAVNAGAKIQ